MNQKIRQLIFIAEEKMKSSRDPIHDLSHVRRVVKNIERFLNCYNFNEKQKQALILAAWWHDVSRTIKDKSSFIVLSLFDDLISAAMLWIKTVRFGLFGSVAGMAVRMIFCKNLGAGAILTRILLKKKDRECLNLLKDADKLDIININRVEQLLLLAENSKIHEIGYRFLIRWYFSLRQLSLKTKAAKRYVIDLLEELLTWMKNPAIYFWHLYYFGKEWVEKTIERIESLFNYLCFQYALQSHY